MLCNRTMSTAALWAMLLLLAVQVLCLRPISAEQEAGTVIPAESKPFSLNVVGHDMNLFWIGINKGVAPKDVATNFVGCLFCVCVDYVNKSVKFFLHLPASLKYTTIYAV